MRASYSQLSFSYLIGFAKEKVRSSERDRGLFIQYLARKYAEHWLNLRGVKLARFLRTLRFSRFHSYAKSVTVAESG